MAARARIRRYAFVSPTSSAAGSTPGGVSSTTCGARVALNGATSHGSGSCRAASRLMRQPAAVLRALMRRGVRNGRVAPRTV